MSSSLAVRERSCMATLMEPLAAIQECDTLQAVAIYACYIFAFVATALTIVGLPLAAWAFYEWGSLVQENAARKQIDQFKDKTTEEKGELQGQLSGIQSANVQLHARVGEVEQEKRVLGKQLEQIRTENARLHQHVAEAEQGLSQMSAAKVALEEQLKTAQETHGVPLLEHQQALDALREISVSLSKKETETPQQAAERARQSIARVNLKCFHKAAENKALTQDVQQARGKNLELSEEIISLQKLIESLGNDNKLLLAKLGDAERRRSSFESGLKEVQTKQQDLMARQEREEQQQKLMQEQMRELQGLRQVNADLTQKVLELTEERRKEKAERKDDFAVPAARPFGERHRALSVDTRLAGAGGGITPRTPMRPLPGRPQRPLALHNKIGLKSPEQGRSSSLKGTKGTPSKQKS